MQCSSTKIDDTAVRWYHDAIVQYPLSSKNSFVTFETTLTRNVYSFLCRRKKMQFSLSCIKKKLAHDIKEVYMPTIFILHMC